MVDKVTHFSAAQSVEIFYTQNVLETMFTLWAAIYTGVPNSFVFDNGSQLRISFVEISDNHDV